MLPTINGTTDVYLILGDPVRQVCAAADPLPCDLSRMAPHAALVDILIKPSPLVRAVRARGLVAQPGFEMMIRQGPVCLDYFGLHEAAQAVQRDSEFIRQQIYPAVLRDETAVS